MEYTSNHFTETAMIIKLIQIALRNEKKYKSRIATDWFVGGNFIFCPLNLNSQFDDCIHQTSFIEEINGLTHMSEYGLSICVLVNDYCLPNYRACRRVRFTKSIKCSDDSSIISEEKNILMSVLTAAMTAFKIYGPFIGYRLSFHSSKCARNHYVIFIGSKSEENGSHMCEI